LLGAITGAVRMDGGRALVGPRVRVGYLKQTAVSGSARTAGEEAASEMEEINRARSEMGRLEGAIAGGDTSERTMNALASANEEFTNAGGWTQEQEVDGVLGGLGFEPRDSSRLCSDFSGGWQMRIALARLLLSKPTLLLLDEPSNHLDSSARDWLGRYLAKYEGSMVLVSHDIPLIEKAVNNIAEVAGGTVLKYVSCSYNKYLEEKEFRAKSAQAEYERNAAEAARLQAYVNKWGASATKASSAQSRVKALERMRREGKLDPPPVAIIETNFKPQLILPPPPRGIGETLLAVRNADIGYEDGAPLLRNISLRIDRGMKLVLRGPNGAGKSTLMAALRGTLDLLGGTRIENEGLRLGIFTQDLAQELDISARAIDLAASHAREGEHGDFSVSDKEVRSVMGRLGLGGEKPLRRVGSLSGGEKARVALSMFALKASNALMLDEPSNHLDVGCIEALSDALGRWGEKDGAIVVVSHDRSFCDAVGFTHVGTVRDGTLTLEERDLNDGDWVQYEINGAATAPPSAAAAAAETETEASSTTTTPEVVLTPEQRKMVFNAPKRIQKLEKLIEDAEVKIAKYDDDMMEVGNDVGKLTDISQLKEKEEEKVMTYMEEWEELEVLLAEVGGQ